MQSKLFHYVKFALQIWLAKTFLFRRYSAVPVRLILAQSALETAFWTSKIFRENKNLFGMKQSFKTPGGFIEIGTLNGHAQYKTYWDSVRDYFVRQNEFNISGLPETYISETVESNYAEDPNYATTWPKFQAQIVEYWAQKRPAVIGLFSFTALIIFICVRYLAKRGKR